MQDATSLAAAIAAGATTASAVMEAALAAAATRPFGAIARLDPAMGRRDAELRPTGPFGGVPFLGKDLGSGAAGLTPQAGSAALGSGSDKRRDSDLFARFRAAGLVPFGLTTVPEFGLALTSDPATNPWDETLSPGGSSGGAAAAVAGGIVAIAHATDAAGSIRVPAACCGLVGLKPSRGVVPQGPDHGNWLMGLAAELVLARSVRDVATAFDAVTDPWTARRDIATPPRLALVIPDGTGPAEADAARRVADAARATGATVTERAPPDRLAARAASLARLILSASLAEWMGAMSIPPDALSPLAAAVMAEGQAMPATTLFAASRELAILTASWEAWLADADAVISPVLSQGVPAPGSFDMTATDPAAHFARMEATAPHAALANAAGFPALVLPLMAGRRPTGVQIAARQGTDRALLALGARIAAKLPPVPYPFAIAGHP